MTEPSNLKNKILKKGTNRTVSEDHFEERLGATTCKNVAENILIDNCRNIPLDVLGQCDRNCYNKHIPHRRYTKAKSIETLAIDKHRQNGQGVCFNDLLSNGLAKHKQQAQATLKHCLRANILFTPYKRKPQQYYLKPVSLLRHMSQSSTISSKMRNDFLLKTLVQSSRKIAGIGLLTP